MTATFEGTGPSVTHAGKTARGGNAARPRRDGPAVRARALLVQQDGRLHCSRCHLQVTLAFGKRRLCTACWHSLGTGARGKRQTWRITTPEAFR